MRSLSGQQGASVRNQNAPGGVRMGHKVYVRYGDVFRIALCFLWKYLSQFLCLFRLKAHKARRNPIYPNEAQFHAWAHA